MRPVSDHNAQDERRFNAFAKSSTGGTWLVEGVVEVAAYGEVVWSWHPLLMPSLAEMRRSNRARTHR